MDPQLMFPAGLWDQMEKSQAPARLDQSDLCLRIDASGRDDLLAKPWISGLHPVLHQPPPFIWILCDQCDCDVLTPYLSRCKKLVIRRSVFSFESEKDDTGRITIETMKRDERLNPSPFLQSIQ